MWILVVILILAIAAGIVGLLYLFFYARHLGRGAHFATTPDEKIAAMLKLAEIKSEDMVADLGSGDGRVVIAAAQTGATIHGYEFNPHLMWRSKRRAKRTGFANVSFLKKDFMKEDLSRYNVILLFGIQFLMPRLEKKLLQELRPGARVVSYYFTFPSWDPSDQKSDVYMYRR